MPDLFSLILWPFKIIIEFIIVAFHTLWTSLGMDPANGWTWMLSLVGLVIVVRSAILPLTIRQIKSQRNMMVAAPEIRKIQEKYRGKRDQFSMEAMQREMREVYARTNSNPMAGCWPLLVQMPILFGLYQVISTAQQGMSGVGMLNEDLARKFAGGEIFGVPLRATLVNNEGNVAVIVLAVVMIVLMTASQYITMRQITSKNVSEEAKNSPMYRQQEIMMRIMPLMFAVSGLFFPIGLMSYWLISNFFTMLQQWLIVRNMPTPGSEAAKAREARLRARGKWVDEDEQKKIASGESEAKVVRSTQRQQPMSKQRAKKAQAAAASAGTSKRSNQDAVESKSSTDASSTTKGNENANDDESAATATQRSGSSSVTSASSTHSTASASKKSTNRSKKKKRR